MKILQFFYQSPVPSVIICTQYIISRNRFEYNNVNIFRIVCYIISNNIEPVVSKCVQKFTLRRSNERSLIDFIIICILHVTLVAVMNALDIQLVV